MNTINLSGFPLGIDQRSEPTALNKNAVLDAVNVNFSTQGNFQRREGVVQAAALTGAHSLWSPKSGEIGLFAHADAVRQCSVQSDGSLGVRTLISGLSLSGHMSFCEYGGEIFFTNDKEVGKIDANGRTTLLGINAPHDPPTLSAGTGGLIAGRYGCAYTLINAAGEESGVSPIGFIDLISGGVLFALPTTPSDATQIRLYMTSVNGELLYQMAQLPAGLTSYNVGDDTPGKQAATQHMHRVTGGSIVRGFHGRLLIAQGSVLVFTEPYNYGLTSRRHNFIQFGSTITMIEIVTSGVFVGTGDAVYFLAGTGPHDMRQEIVSTNPPIQQTSTMIESSRLPEDLERLSDEPAAIWLGRKGYSVGLSNGTVKDVQSNLIDLPKYDRGATAYITKTGISQVISIVQS